MKSREQLLIDILFEIVMRTYVPDMPPVLIGRDGTTHIFQTREDYAKWIASQLNALGFEGGPVGCSWFVLKD